jgi:hypothetical protein
MMEEYMICGYLWYPGIPFKQGELIIKKRSSHPHPPHTDSVEDYEAKAFSS